MVEKTIAPSMPYKLAFLVACMIAVTDIHVPSLSQMVSDFNSTEAMLQLTLTLCCFGFLLSSLIIGPVADAIGRRLTLFICAGLAFFSTLLCSFAPNLETLFVCRILQGMASAGGPILAMTIIADTYKGYRFQQMTALIGMVLTFTLSLAPVVGGYIGDYFGWRMTFLFLSSLIIFTALLLAPSLPETLSKKRALVLKDTFQSYKKMLFNWSVVGNGLLTATMIGTLIAHAGMGSYYFVDVLGLSQSHYGFFQGAGSLGNALFCLLTARWIKRFGAGRILKAGMISVFISALLLTAAVFLTPINPYLLTAPLFIFGAGLAMTFAPSIHKAMTPYLDQAGTVSAFLSTLRMLVAVFLTFMAGILYSGSALSMGLIFSFFALSTVGIYLTVRNDETQ